MGMDKAAAARQKKIEAGKQKLTKFQKKRKKIALQQQAALSDVSNGSTPNSISESSLDDNMTEKLPSEENESSCVFLTREDEETTAMVLEPCQETDPSQQRTLISSSDNFTERASHSMEQVEMADLDDWSSTDDMQALQSYGSKIKNLQEVIKQRDLIISHLSSRLEIAIESVNVFESRDSQHDAMVKDLETYKIQLQQAKETLSKQKSKNGISMQDFLDTQQHNIALQEKIASLVTENQNLAHQLLELNRQMELLNSDNINKSLKTGPRAHVPSASTEFSTNSIEIGIQVESFSCPLADKLLVSHYDGNENLTSMEKQLFHQYQAVIIEKNRLQEILNHLEQNENIADLANTSSDKCSSRGKHLEQTLINNCEQSLLNSMQRMMCINNIAKSVNSLLSGLHLANSQILESSNTQLSRLNTSDVIVQRDPEFAPSPISNALGTQNSNTSNSTCCNSSIEVLRSSELTQNLLRVKDFLQQEMQSSHSLFSSTLEGSRFIELKQSDLLLSNDLVGEKTADIEPSIQASDEEITSNQLFSSEWIIQEKYNFENNMQQLEEWVNSFQGQVISLDTSSKKQVSPEFDLTLEEMPGSTVSLVSLTDSERFDVTRPQNDLVLKQNDGTNTVKDNDIMNENVPDNALSTDETMKELTLSHKHIKMLKEQHINELSNLRTEMEHSYRKEEILSDKINHLENQNVLHLQNSSHFQSQLVLQLSSMNETIENSVEILEAKLDEKIQELSLVKSKFQVAKHAFEKRHQKDVVEIKEQTDLQKCKLKNTISDLKKEFEISVANATRCEEEKLKLQCDFRNEMADLIAEHEEDLKNERENLQMSFREKETLLEQKQTVIVNELEEKHRLEIEMKKREIELSIMEKIQNVKDDYHKVIHDLEAKHSVEVSECQKKVENLLEEKCQLLERSKGVYEKIFQQNQMALHDLCVQIVNQICKQKKRIESSRSEEFTDNSFVETLDELTQNIKTDIDVLLKQKHLQSDDLILTIEGENNNISSESAPPAKLQSIHRDDLNQFETRKSVESQGADAESFVENLPGEESERFQWVIEEINQAKYEFENRLQGYKTENEKLADELHFVNEKLSSVEEFNKKLLNQLKEKEAQAEANSTELDGPSVRESITSPMLSSNDLYNVAQMNFRLLHVLSDVVKTFLEIERDINSRLMEFGLSGSPSVGLGHQDDDTGQSVGSREDFAGLGTGESFNLELHEDGPDLTPRTWNLVKSMGEYDADAEGEDVVIGTTRRVRQQVDHLLHLLTIVFDKSKEQDFKALLRRNEELSQELEVEASDRDSMQMNLVTAQSVIRACEADKQKLEDEIYQLVSEKEGFSQEITSLRQKVCQLDDDKELMIEEKRQMQSQLVMLSSRLGDPEKMTPCREKLSHEVQELLQENTKLSTEKSSIQKTLSKEKQTLATRMHQLELAIEELTAQRDDIIEKSRHDSEDHKSQLESVEKQLISYKKFIDEQALEREQERDEFLREVRKLNGQIREKDKVQNIENQRNKENENLEHQLRVKISEHRTVISKKEEIEKELRQARDIIHDLREVITELEKQLECKSRGTFELEQKLGNALKSVSAHEEHNADLANQLNERSISSVDEEVAEKLRSLEEQLESKSQELEQMVHSEILLKELRGQIHFLEAKVDQKIRQVESMHLVSLLASPVLSDDASHTESHDGEQHQLQYEDGWEMSPRSIHWLEIRRLEEKVCRLIQMEEELIKQNKDMSSQLKKIKHQEEEWCHDKAALQQQAMDQLFQISSLKTNIDELRQRIQPPISNQVLSEIEKLRDSLEHEQEQRKIAFHEVLDLKHEVHELQNNISEKSYLIEKLKMEAHLHQLQCSNPNETDGQDSLVEFAMSTPKSESLIPVVWQKLLQEKSAKINRLNDELTDLRLKFKQTEERTGGKLSDVYNEVHISQVCQSSTEIQQQMTPADEEKMSGLIKRVEKVEGLLQKSKTDLEIEQSQLEKDFDTVQDMMQKKEKELTILHEETENQLRLESDIDMLQQQLAEQQYAKEQLSDKLQTLETELKEAKLLHSQDVEKWKQKSDEIIRRYKLKLEALRKQIAVLKSDLLLSEKFEDIDIKEVQEKIVDAAVKLKGSGENSENLFREIVYRILQQAVELKSNLLKNGYETQMEETNKSWCQKLREMEEDKRAAENLSEAEIEALNNKIRDIRKKFDVEMKQLFMDKDTFWQERLDEMEMTFKKDSEHLKELMFTHEQLDAEVRKRIEVVEARLKNKHKKEMDQWKVKIDEVVKDKETNEEQLKSLYEKERVILLQECDSKFTLISKQLENKFDKEKLDICANYERQLQELELSLRSKLDQERKEVQEKHLEQLQSVREIFAKKWTVEAQRFEDIHTQELQALNDSKQKNTEEIIRRFNDLYEKKLQNIQLDCETQLTEERQRSAAQQQQELEELRKNLEKKFEHEKRHWLEQREQQLKTELQQKFDKEFLECLEARELMNLENNIKVLEESWQKKVAITEKKLRSAHQKEMVALQQGFDVQLKAQAKAHEDYLKVLQEQYNGQLRNAHDVITALKTSSTGFLRSSISDVTSSEDTASNVGDVSPCDDGREVKKIYNYSVKTLALTEHFHQQENEKTAELLSLRDEKMWIISRLKCVLLFEENQESELKSMIEKLIEEIELSRKNIRNFASHDKHLNKQICHLKQKLNSRESELALKTENIGQLEALLCARNRRAHYATDIVRNGDHYSETSEKENGCYSSIEQPRSASFFRSIDLSCQAPLICDPSLSPERMNSLKTISPRMVSKFSLGDCSKEEHCSASQLQYLYWNFRRCHSHRKALIFQKNYLLKLLSSFQSTEDMTIAFLARMGVSISNHPNEAQFFPHSSDAKPRGSALFRSAAHAIIAISRMKFFAFLWRQAAATPSSETIHKDLHNTSGDITFRSFVSSKDQILRDSSFASSNSASVEDCRNSRHSNRSSRSSASQSHKSERGQLQEYVNRLELLHRQLGLDDSNRS